MIAKSFNRQLFVLVAAVFLGCGDQQNVPPENPPDTLPAPTPVETDSAK
jgi:hypothetical protein